MNRPLRVGVRVGTLRPGAHWQPDGPGLRVTVTVHPPGLAAVPVTPSHEPVTVDLNPGPPAPAEHMRDGRTRVAAGTARRVTVEGARRGPRP